jgi:hypothetical protein
VKLGTIDVRAKSEIRNLSMANGPGEKNLVKPLIHQWIIGRVASTDDGLDTVPGTGPLTNND